MFFLLLMNHLQSIIKLKELENRCQISELFFGRLAIERLETST